MRSVKVCASAEYRVLIGEGLLARCGEFIVSAVGGAAAMLVCDDTVNELYAEEAERSLRGAGYVCTRFVFSHGEQSKNMQTYISLLSAMAKAGLTRTDVVVALGGGVTGDMAGFAAATYLRGIPFAQIPTTLLAMVDSSVGGKTAVDLPQGKNLAGAFYQPGIVLCDAALLKTLPDGVFRDGCAEMIKHGVILSAELFGLLKEPLWPKIEEIIERNVTVKRDIVNADEREKGLRRILNFGHTLGHGIERDSGYSVTHGSAVAIGMALAAKGAMRMGICSEVCYGEIVEMLKRHRLPCGTQMEPKRLMEAAFFDKKRNGRHIAVILPKEIGACTVQSFDMSQLWEFIRLSMLD